MIFVKVHKIRPFWSLIQSMAYPGRFAIQFLYNQGWITGVRLHRLTALYRLLDYSPEEFIFSHPSLSVRCLRIPQYRCMRFWRRAVMRPFPSSKPRGESRSVPFKSNLRHAAGERNGLAFLPAAAAVPGFHTSGIRKLIVCSMISHPTDVQSSLCRLSLPPEA